MKVKLKFWPNVSGGNLEILLKGLQQYCQKENIMHIARDGSTSIYLYRTTAWTDAKIGNNESVKHIAFL